MVVVPAAMPVANPLDEPMVAIAGAPLIHEPPEVVLVRVVVAPAHIVVVPAIAAGSGLTIIEAVARQPVGSA